MMKSPMALEQCKVLEAGLALGPEVDFDFGLLLLHDYTWSISGITPFSHLPISNHFTHI